MPSRRDKSDIVGYLSGRIRPVDLVILPAQRRLGHTREHEVVCPPVRHPGVPQPLRTAVEGAAREPWRAALRLVGEQFGSEEQESPFP